ncbi:MAG: LuxR C-terminal-related transcriptional regulator [Actinobacteria bacterium]|nr:LuxR C-terminal-related transcriptional regulator [Actinomycetota bacterium]
MTQHTDGANSTGAWAGWVLLARDTVPHRWRGRSTPVSLVAITPDEAAAFSDDRVVHPSLSPEDELVLSLLLAGETITAIARQLRISPRSVQRRLVRLRNAFNAASNADLVVAAARAGFR